MKSSTCSVIEQIQQGRKTERVVMATETELVSAANCTSVNLPADDAFTLRCILKNTSTSDAAANYVLSAAIDGLNTRSVASAGIALVKLRRAAETSSRKVDFGWSRDWPPELGCWTSTWG